MGQNVTDHFLEMLCLPQHCSLVKCKFSFFDDKILRSDSLNFLINALKAISFLFSPQMMQLSFLNEGAVILQANSKCNMDSNWSKC